MVLYGIHKGMSMKKTLMCATAAAAFASAGFMAHAEDGWYARGDLGWVVDGTLDHDAPTDVLYTLGSDSDTSEDVVLGGLGLGYGFDNGFRLETALTHRAGDLDVPVNINGGVPETIGSLIDARGLNQGTEVRFERHQQGKLQSWDLMVNGLYDFNRDGSFQPYLGAGIGVAKVKAKVSNLTAVQIQNGVAPQTFAANGFSDSETAAAYQALAGVGYNVTDRLTADLGYRLFYVDDLDFNGVDNLGNEVVYDATYIDHAVTFGLRYALGAPAAPPPD